jgi:hypothetical protein
MAEPERVQFPPTAVQPDEGKRRFGRLRAFLAFPVIPRPRLAAVTRAAAVARSPAQETEDPDAAARLYGPRWCVLHGLNRLR